MSTIFPPGANVAFGARALRPTTSPEPSVTVAPEPHDHDWRVNPSVLLTTTPPKRQLMCAICRSTTYRPVDATDAVDPVDPRTWPAA